MAINELALSRLYRTQKKSLAVAIIGAVVLVLGLFLDSKQFFSSYLIGYMYILSISLGCLGLILLHNLVGGGWGTLVRPYLEAGSRLLPILALLFIPIFIGFHKLYPWAHDHSALIEAKKLYLNQTFFWFRAVLYFVLWTSFTLYFNKKGVLPEGSPEQSKNKGLSGVALILFFLSVTFASIDWVMSLDPFWYSSMFGVLQVAQSLMSTFSLLIILVALSVGPDVEKEISIEHLHAMGKFLFMSVMFWAYISFSQLLIIWAGQIPEETVWYYHRFKNGWKIIAFALISLQFFVPFFILLSRKIKRKLHQVTKVAVWLLVMRVFEEIWIIRPTTHPEAHFPHWMDFVAVLALSAIFLSLFIRNYRKQGAINAK
jgi:hypothetical protein